MAIKTKGIEIPNFFRALQRFQKEDPTFKAHMGQTSAQTISGMGELHLETYVERMKREYNVDCTTGKPRVNFRATVTRRAEFNYTHKRQTRGAGQYARIVEHIEPTEYGPEPGKDVGFENVVMGCFSQGIYEALEKGNLSGNTLIAVWFSKKEPSTRLTLQNCASKEAYKSARPVILEPIMTVEVMAPAEFQGQVIRSLHTRRGTVIDSEVLEVALNNMFGYSNQLRGATQGKGEFSMEFKSWNGDDLYDGCPRFTIATKIAGYFTYSQNSGPRATLLRDLNNEPCPGEGNAIVHLVPMWKYSV
ncbi:Elongation Factor G, domain II domain containing protein [Amanita muscaria]